VLALVTEAFGCHGGIAHYNQDLLSALASSSRISDVLVVPRHGENLSDELPAWFRGTHPTAGRFSYAAKVFAQALSRRSFDLVFCGHIYMSPLAASVAAMLRKPMWLQLHGIEAWEPPGRLARAAVEKASLVTAVSRCTRDRFLKWANVVPERVRVLPNTFHPQFAPGAKREALVELHKLRGKRVLLTVSRLAASERYKGHDRVINALPGVLEFNPDVVYLIVGDGDDRPRLEKLAHSADVVEAIRFVGHVPHSELPDYFRLGDVFIMPSIGEGFGIVFLEAAASGLALIGGNCDGSCDALADGVIGCIVDPHDQAGLLEAIRRALSQRQKELSCDVGKNESSYARFSVLNFNKHVDELIRSSITPTRRPVTPRA
jgi:phosphatidylinositol alpha-1,6-mannosyltransferase